MATLTTALVTAAHGKHHHRPRFHNIEFVVEHEHPKKSQHFIFPFGPQVITVDNLSPQFSTVERAGRYPLLLQQSKTLHTIAFQLVCAHQRGLTNVGGYYHACVLLSRTQKLIKIKYNRLTVGHWKCTACTINTVTLGNHNEVTQFTANFTFTRASTLTVPSGPVHGGHHHHHNKKGKNKKGRHNHHHVVTGDTLFGIALTYYDDVEQWRSIADANHIVHPGKIVPGTKLLLPGV